MAETMECLVLGPAPFTRDELVERGLKPEAADELVEYATKLRERHAMRAAGLTPVDQTQFGRGEGNCFAACIATLTGLDLAMLTQRIGMGSGEDEEEHWFTRAGRVLAELGWSIHYDTAEAPPGWCIASGPAARGLLHSTVALNGAVIHDPHPSRAGLLEITDYIWLSPLAAPRQPSGGA